MTAFDPTSSSLSEDSTAEYHHHQHHHPYQLQHDPPPRPGSLARIRRAFGKQILVAMGFVALLAVLHLILERREGWWAHSRYAVSFPTKPRTSGYTLHSGDSSLVAGDAGVSSSPSFSSVRKPFVAMAKAFFGKESVQEGGQEENGQVSGAAKTQEEQAPEQVKSQLQELESGTGASLSPEEVRGAAQHSSEQAFPQKQQQSPQQNSRNDARQGQDLGFKYAVATGGEVEKEMIQEASEEHPGIMSPELSTAPREDQQKQQQQQQEAPLANASQSVQAPVGSSEALVAEGTATGSPPTTTESSPPHLTFPPILAPRVFDLIFLNDELDALELRLTELYEVVDHFYVVEHELTFSNSYKPLHFRVNRSRFQRFLPKIIHIVLPQVSEKEQLRLIEITGLQWYQEAYTRNMGLSMGLDILRPNEGDWIMMSDLDELIHPDVARALKEKNPDSEMGRQFWKTSKSVVEGGEDFVEAKGEIFRLRGGFYYYSFEFRMEVITQEVGPMVVRFREEGSDFFKTERERWELVPEFNEIQNRTIAQPRIVKGLNPSVEFMTRLAKNDWVEAGRILRGMGNPHRTNGSPVKLVFNACWHCSWCFRNLSMVLNKLAAYSHPEHNLPQFRDTQWLLGRIREGEDLLNRTGLVYSYVPMNEDLPGTLKTVEGRERYGFMLERKGKLDAGFMDVEVDEKGEVYLVGQSDRGGGGATDVSAAQVSTTTDVTTAAGDPSTTTAISSL